METQKAKGFQKSNLIFSENYYTIVDVFNPFIVRIFQKPFLLFALDSKVIIAFEFMPIMNHLTNYRVRYRTSFGIQLSSCRCEISMLSYCGSLPFSQLELFSIQDLPQFLSILIFQRFKPINPLFDWVKFYTF